MRGRAYRRHQQERIKQRVQHYYGGYARGIARHVGRLTQARTPCSCWMCGNPRRYWREQTLQERRAGQEG